MQLSIIIVNYKSSGLILDCLGSFVGSMTITYEVIIVDNASGDDSEEKILKEYPFVKWIQMDYNAGFGRANNAGMRIAQGDAVLLLNPDTINLDNAIEKSYQRLMISEYVACGVQLLNEDHTPQISGNYAMKGGLNYLLPLPYIGAVMKFVGTALSVKKPNVPNAMNSVVEVDWINGAYLMVKKSAISKAGLFDEDFFLYAEEPEWCSRLKKVGKLCIFGDYNVVHLQGETANDTFNSEGKGYYNLYDKKGKQLILSNAVRIRKEFGIFWYFVNQCAYLFAIPIFWIAGIFHNIITLKNPFRHFKKAAGFTRNVFAVLKYMPFIVAKKPKFYKVL